MPELSILLPVRNAESTIKSAVVSTLRAMPQDAELVIFDDGSTDSTGLILGEIGDKRLRVLESPNSAGGGVANALNELLRHTDSDFVARMDADDICIPHRFWLQRRQIDRSESQILFGTVVHFGAGFPVPRPSIPARISPEAMRIALLISNPVAHSTLYGRRQVIEEAGGYRPGPAEDYELWLRLSSSGVPIERGGTPVLAYRHHVKQVTAGSNWQREVHSDPSLNRAYVHCLNSVLGLNLDTHATSLQQSQYRTELELQISHLESQKDRRYLTRYMRGKFSISS
ncbi:glycosyltransferase family 2 protein [Rhodococcus cerastii]|uniref:glycosyltransferase family 2 protein n=1 Tax=Rhodococcus cerastii TaxID=908616 RepID=UPI00374EF6E7